MEIFTLDCEPLHPKPKRIEIASSLRIPGIHIVGPTSKEKSDAQHRVRLAIESSGIRIPKRQLTIQIPCTRLKKYLEGYDLAVCLAISSLSLPLDPSIRIFAWGRVSIAGRVESGSLTSQVRFATQKQHFTHLICSKEDLQNPILQRSADLPKIIAIEHFQEVEKAMSAA